MYWPLVGLGKTVEKAMAGYREVFSREAGFGHVSRYINGLLLPLIYQRGRDRIEKKG